MGQRALQHRLPQHGDQGTQKAKDHKGARRAVKGDVEQQQQRRRQQQQDQQWIRLHQLQEQSNAQMIKKWPFV